MPTGSWTCVTLSVIWLFSKPLQSHPLVDEPDLLLGRLGAGLGSGKPRKVDHSCSCYAGPYLCNPHFKKLELCGKRYRAHKLNGNILSQNGFYSFFIPYNQRSRNVSFFYYPHSYYSKSARKQVTADGIKPESPPSLFMSDILKFSNV